MKDKATIGLAGEYAVAAELCRRGFNAQLTLGNHKKTDLLVDGLQGLARVSVKAKTGYAWPSVKGIWQTNDFLIFVDFHNKEVEDRPDFYVLEVADWKKVVKALQKKKGGGAKIDTENTLYWEPWKSAPKGRKGCSVNVSDVQSYKDNWPTQS